MRETSSKEEIGIIDWLTATRKKVAKPREETGHENDKEEEPPFSLCGQTPSASVLPQSTPPVMTQSHVQPSPLVVPSLAPQVSLRQWLTLSGEQLASPPFFLKAQPSYLPLQYSDTREGKSTSTQAPPPPPPKGQSTPTQAPPPPLPKGQSTPTQAPSPPPPKGQSTPTQALPPPLEGQSASMQAPPPPPDRQSSSTLAPPSPTERKSTSTQALLPETKGQSASTQAPPPPLKGLSASRQTPPPPPKEQSRSTQPPPPPPEAQSTPTQTQLPQPEGHSTSTQTSPLPPVELGRMKQIRKEIRDSRTFYVEQPGLRKYFEGGKENYLVMCVKEKHSCALHIQKSFVATDEDESSTVAYVSSVTSAYDEDSNDACYRDDENDNSTLRTKYGHKISWKPGCIEKEKAQVLISAQGTCAQAIIKAGGPKVASLKVGDVMTLQGLVRKCMEKSEELRATSIAFPVLGTRKLKFPRYVASRVMLEEVITFCNAHPGSITRDILFVVYQQDQALTTAFKQEMEKLKVNYKVHKTFKKRPVLIEVVHGDLCREETDVIVDIVRRDLNMDRGMVSKALKKQGGQQIQEELNDKFKQQPCESAVMTTSGELLARHVIHLVSDSANKDHLQQCLERCLQLAETHGLGSISIPAIGTGTLKMSAIESANVIYRTLNNFCGSFSSVHTIRIVIFQVQMMQAFQQYAKEIETQRIALDGCFRVNVHNCIEICVLGLEPNIKEAIEFVKKSFSKALITEKVESDVVSQLSHETVETLRRKADARDVKLEVEDFANRILVQGDSTEVNKMVVEIMKELDEIKEKKYVHLISKSVEWGYEKKGTKVVFNQRENAMIETAHNEGKSEIKVPLTGEQFYIDLTKKIGRGQQSGDQITLTRKTIGVPSQSLFFLGYPPPRRWTPMPRRDMNVHTVVLSPHSWEYKEVKQRFEASKRGCEFKKIERVQNPHLWQAYMLRKHKMLQDCKGDIERLLFHGTDAKNISHINAQGFNRSFCGVHGTKYGQGVYFAKDANYSVRFTRKGGDGCHMYLARVLVGKYCIGKKSMKVPLPIDPSTPEVLHDSAVDQIIDPRIFVVFYDNQCYQEYHITFV